MERSVLSPVVFMIALLVTGSMAWADLIGPVVPPEIHISVDSLPDQAWRAPITLDDFVPPGWDRNGSTPPGLIRNEGVLNGKKIFNGIFNGTANVTIEEIAFDPDPYVLMNILVTNTQSTTQTFNATNVLATSFNVSPNLIAGSVTVQVIDGGSDGATLGAPGKGSIYQAQIDGTTIKTLLDAPYQLVCSSAGATSAVSHYTSFDWQLNNTPVLSSIGIDLNFTLTPGDSAAILSRFDVVAPEPASLILLGAGGLVMLYPRRRH